MGKNIDIFGYNPSPAEIVVTKGTIIGTVTDISTVIPLPIFPESKIGVDVTELNVDEPKSSEVHFDLNHLKGKEREIALELLEEEKGVFSNCKNDICHIKDFKLKIDLVDDIPVSEAYRRIPNVCRSKKSHK